MNIEETIDERDPNPACLYCEHAKRTSEKDLFVFCTIRSLETACSSLCPHYIYDLLKRVPPKPTALSDLPFELILEDCDL